MRKVLAVLILLLMFSGCAATSSAQRSVFEMDTIMTVTVYGDNCEVAADDAVEFISQLSRRWSVTDERSEIYALNTAGAAQLSPETAELVRFALEMNAATDGALDITLYPVLREWGFTTDEHRIPSDERLGELLQLTGADKVTLTEGGAQLSEGTQTDLGAVAKGYAGDLLCERLRAQGIESALLDLGGNIHAVGGDPDGGAWRLGVRDPDGEGNIAILELTDMAAVTSGGYERYFVGEDGVHYHHILDPKTGRPADSGLKSVTVIGREGRLCDALSTAVYVMGAERARELHKSLGGFELLMITDGGEMLITEGLRDILTVTEEFSGSVRVLS